MSAAAIAGPLARKLRRASILLAVGLLIQAITLARPTVPATFLLFALLGVPLVLAGIVLYLVAIVTHKEPAGEAPPPA